MDKPPRNSVDADRAQTVASLLSSAPTRQMKEATLIDSVDRDCHEAGKAGTNQASDEP